MVDAAEDGCVVRSERFDGASSGWVCRLEALEMALFDQALLRPWRNTPLRAARSMHSFTMAHVLGRRPARCEDWMSSMTPDSRQCGGDRSMPRASVPEGPDVLR